MTPGTQIIYIPVIANGDATHPDCIPGFIAGPRMGRSIYAHFWDVVGVSLRTARLQLTDSERLVAMDSVEQEVVNTFLEKNKIER